MFRYRVGQEVFGAYPNIGDLIPQAEAHRSYLSMRSPAGPRTGTVTVERRDYQNGGDWVEVPRKLCAFVDCAGRTWGLFCKEHRGML